MANNSTSQSPIPVQLRSLSLFFLPKDLIASLELSNSLITASTTPAEPTHTQDILPLISTHGSNLDTIATPSSSTSTITPSCRVCGIVRLDSVEHQREHVKSEWHRYNLKQQILDKAAQPIQEQHFKRLAAQLSLNQRKEDTGKGHKPQKHTKRSSRRNSDNSILGEDATDGKDDLMQCLLRDLETTLQENESLRLNDPMRIAQEQALELQRQKARMSPLIWFTTSLYGMTVRLGVYKNSLVNKGQCEDPKAYLDSVQIAVAPIPPKKIKLKRAARAKLLEQQQQQQQQLEPGNAYVDVLSEASEQLKPMDEAPELPLSLPLDPSPRPRYWTMLLLGGGHFAGMVIDLNGQVKRYSRVREMKIEVHKTFHRYTVRRKNGGAQSSFGAANSAGAMVRMYNEAALRLEVRELLEKKWSEWIQKSEMVFMHAPGNNRRTVIYDGSVIAVAEKDGRLRSIPFVTRRPTLTEVKRCYSELTAVQVSTLPQEELEALEQAEAEALQKDTEEQKQEDEDEDEDEDDKEEEEEEEKEDTDVIEPPKDTLSLAETLKLVELVRKGRADAVSTHLLRYGTNPSQLLPAFPPKKEYDFHRTPTLLHLAAHHGRAEVVKVLLEKHLVDPTTSYALQTQGEDITASLPTAYEVAKDKETRNTFRRAMARMPDQWEWRLLAHVPAPLTPEMEHRAKNKSRRQFAGEKERKKTRKTRRIFRIAHVI
ncbi:hypothetical protein BG005_003587 [Podila minutissima]|nr:hypothetical protein BG005_003587 [Podila minutissima]